MGIDIGKLDQRITFERRTETLTATGATTETWSAFATCWAHVMSRGGAKVEEASSLIPRHTWSIRTRYRNDASPKDRIVYQGKTLSITSISHDSTRSSMTEFLCTEYVGE